MSIQLYTTFVGSRAAKWPKKGPKHSTKSQEISHTEKCSLSQETQESIFRQVLDYSF